MRELLLLSNSTAPGMGFLEHATQAIGEVLGDRGSLVFVPAGIPYLAASAGANLACPTIRTTNDMPIVEPGSLAALGLIPFQLNPHYLDPDPHSPHQGETRPKRIGEFLEENDVPVLGLREGAWLRVSGPRAHLAGRNTGRLFRRRTESIDIPVGADLSGLLNTCPRFDTGTTA